MKGKARKKGGCSQPTASNFWIPHNLPCAMAATSDNEEFDAMALPARWKERRPGAACGRLASEAMEAGAEVFIGKSSAPRRYGTGAGSFTGHTWAQCWLGVGWIL